MVTQEAHFILGTGYTIRCSNDKVIVIVDETININGASISRCANTDICSYDIVKLCFKKKICQIPKTNETAMQDRKMNTMLKVRFICIQGKKSEFLNVILSYNKFNK